MNWKCKNASTRERREFNDFSVGKNFPGRLKQEKTRKELEIKICLTIKYFLLKALSSHAAFNRKTLKIYV